MTAPPSEELQRLIDRLNAGEITPEEFERQSAELVESIGSGEAEETKLDKARLERIDAAASKIRNL